LPSTPTCVSIKNGRKTHPRIDLIKWTHSGNHRAVGLAKKSGFQSSYRQRGAIFKNGQLLDNLQMDLLREEYYAQHPALTDHLPEL
jgi:hypothetical protein